MAKPKPVMVVSSVRMRASTRCRIASSTCPNRSVAPASAFRQSASSGSPVTPMTDFSGSFGFLQARSASGSSRQRSASSSVARSSASPARRSSDDAPAISRAIPCISVGVFSHACPLGCGRKDPSGRSVPAASSTSPVSASSGSR
ncbi:hypothetical protein CMMCAS05_13865 [Clavibacter michiganensis subsp. michiganensis]|nr:hypothetical protein CMMCAS05_13865 [Clavibacter michiganensis subsp. michiganensis]